MDTAPGTFAAIRDTLAPELIGADPREIKSIEEMLDDRLEGCLMAKGALDMAMYDRAGPSTEERDRIKALERENRDLRQANEILRKASAYFAQAELDRPFKR